MAKSDKIRNYGLIPERRHDAFLLALLLSLAVSAAFFAVQAIIPRLSSLLELLAPESAMREEEEALPFVLVDPNLFDEPVDEEPPDAESLVDREARQAEPPPPELPEDKPYVEEGVDELQSMPEGNPGPAEASPVNAPESTESEPSPEQAPAEPMEPVEVDPAEPMEMPEPPEEIPEEPEPEPVPEPEPEPIPEPEPEPVPEPEPEPIQNLRPPPEPMPEPAPEPLPEPPPESFPEPPPAEPMEEPIDLAMLPVTPDGFYPPPPRPTEYAAPDPPPPERPQPQVRPQPEPEPPRRREGRRQPAIRQIGGRESAASAPSRAGGAPRHRNTDSRINLLDSDPNMKYLAHKYADYMRNLAKLLQESLNREVLLQPVGYTTGQAKLIFTIAPDGRLGAYRTVYPADGGEDYVRITSEQTLVNAGPFEPPTPEMLRDPVFKQMSLTVNLY